MLEFKREQLLTLREAAARLPGPTSYKTVWEWVRHGHKGIKLESLKLGGRWITSVEALQRFAEAVTEAEQVEQQRISVPPRGYDKHKAAVRRRLREDHGL